MGVADGETVELEVITQKIEDERHDSEPLLSKEEDREALLSKEEDFLSVNIPVEESWTGLPPSSRILFAALVAVALLVVATVIGALIGMSDHWGEGDHEGPIPGRAVSGGPYPPPASPHSPPPDSQGPPPGSTPEGWNPSQTPPVLPLYHAPPLPRRANVMRLDDFGAVGDGVTMNTEAFERAIEAVRRKPGGTVLVVSAGQWLTGPFSLTSHLTLQLNAGATILASQVFDHYASIPPFPSYFDPDDLTRLQYRAFISGTDLVDVTITGTGTIDGQGKPWWDARGANASFWSAPRLVEFVSSTDILITGITLQNSQMWTLHPIYCKRVHIHGLTILAPIDSHNTDGINPDSTEDVVIENCRINTGDDSIAIKSGRDNFGIAVGRPSRNITARSLTLGPGTHGISIGSELSGGISEVTVQDIIFLGGANGLRIKTTAGRGGFVRNVLFERVWIQDVKRAVMFTSEYSSKRDWHPGNNYNETLLTTTENITVSKLAAFSCTNGVVIEGFPTLPFAVDFKDVLLVDSEIPWKCENATGQLSNVNPVPPPSCPLTLTV